MRAFGPHLFLSPEQVVQRALALAHVGAGELVTVAGPDGLAAMVSLCRAGFERVECARRATCGGADEDCALLLIAGQMTPDALAETVRATARLLHDDGLLVVQLSADGDDAVVRSALASRGLKTTFTLFDRSAGRLVLHRVRRTIAELRHSA